MVCGSEDHMAYEITDCASDDSINSIVTVTDVFVTVFG